VFNYILNIFKSKKAVDASIEPVNIQPNDPLNGYEVGEGYDLLISDITKINDWSICQLCLDLVENKTKNVPTEYWCCPDCASEAIEIPYMELRSYIEKNPTDNIKSNLTKWQATEDIASSYKRLKELRFLKLIELSKNT
jgi:hypothetical protein